MLINPLPVYGLAMGLGALMIGLALRSREARTGAFALILIAADPKFVRGQQFHAVGFRQETRNRERFSCHKR